MSSGPHAIVIGASMGGMLAARALLGPYASVTLLDRDSLPTDGNDRRGVPQGRHTHLLLSRGAEILGAMFPGLLADFAADGAQVLNHWQQGNVSLGGHQFTLPDGPAEPPIYASSRPFLESRVRTRLAAMRGIEFRSETEVTGLVTTPGAERVTGVRLRHDGVESELSADLVVDSTGRGGRAPVWLSELGYPAPVENRLPIDLQYVTRRVRMPVDALGDVRIVVVGPRPSLPRGMFLLALEDGQWIHTTTGYAEHKPPSDPAGFEAFNATVAPPAVVEALRTAEPITDLVIHRFPANLRRRYEKLDRFPQAFLVVGDAICSFNPLYGQGMTVAALQAQALRRCLLRPDRRGRDLAPRFFEAAAKPVDVAWQFALGGDLALPVVPGPRSAQVKVLNAWAAKVEEAAASDPVVAECFLRVTGFLDPPTDLFSPDIVRRVLRRTPAVPVDPAPVLAEARAPSCV